VFQKKFFYQNLFLSNKKYYNKYVNTCEKILTLPIKSDKKMVFYFNDESLKIDIESMKDNKYYITEELKLRNFFPLKNYSNILDFKNNKINKWSLVGKTYSKANQNLSDFYRLVLIENTPSKNFLVSYKIIEILVLETLNIIKTSKSFKFSQITCKSLIINKSDYRLFFKSLVILDLKSYNMLSNETTRLYGLQGLNYYSEREFLSVNKFQVDSSLFLDTKNKKFKRIYMNGYKTKLFFNVDNGLLLDIHVKKGFTDFVIETDKNENKLVGVGNITRRLFLNPNEMFFGEFQISMHSKFF